MCAGSLAGHGDKDHNKASESTEGAEREGENARMPEMRGREATKVAKVARRRSQHGDGIWI